MSKRILMMTVALTLGGFVQTAFFMPRTDAQGSAAPDILSFYARAVAVTLSPPEQSRLSILKQARVNTNQGELYISFISADKRKVLLAATSQRELRDPDKAISLRDWVSGRTRGPDAVEWMYVFDRGGAGKIDYVVWPVGFLPVMPNTLPPNFPTRQDQGLTLDQLRFISGTGQLVFQHWAADDTEGKVSGVVLEALASGSEIFIGGRQFIRSSHVDGKLDECWYFGDSISEKLAECERTADGDGYQTRRRAHRPFYPVDFDRFSQWFEILNKAVVLCGLTRDSF